MHRNPQAVPTKAHFTYLPKYFYQNKQCISVCALELAARPSFSTGTHNVMGGSMESSVQVADSLSPGVIPVTMDQSRASNTHRCTANVQISKAFFASMWSTSCLLDGKSGHVFGVTWLIMKESMSP